MVNFRYHIVSIVAVFLALGIGVLVGTTVVDRFTLDFLKDEVERADNSVSATQRENAQLREGLRGERELFDDWNESTARRILGGALARVPVLVVSVEGVDEDPIEELRTALADADARYEGTLRFTERLRLDDDRDVTDLARLVGIGGNDPEAVRQELVKDLAAVLVARGQVTPNVADTTLIAELIREGFVDYDRPGSDAPEPGALPLAGTRYVMVGGPQADVPAGQLLEPLLAAMGGDAIVPVVAAVAGPARDATEETADDAVSFVRNLRSDDDLAAHVSTVDNLGTFPGQAAAVLALQQLAGGEVGHYGITQGAESLLPPDTP